MAQAGSIWVKIGLKLDDFNKNMSRFEKDMNRLGSKISGIGSKLTQGFTLPLVGTGVAAVKSADEIDKAFARIRIGTGATGKQLEELEKSFSTVFKKVPMSSEAVSIAISELNTRTGQTGKALEKLARQMLNLSKIQKTDINQTIETSTRLFGDWSVSTDDQAEAMDKLFRISQQTGPTVDRIGQLMVQYGAPLRQMGFSFEQTAMLMGKFEKEGVNTELVMSSMRQGLAKFAKAGEEPVQALRRIMSEIKNTASIAVANVKAIEVFGARSGPDMAAAIREGRFELENLKKALAGSHETINQAADDSLTFGDSLQKLTNRLQTAFEPLGTTLINAINQMMPTIEKAIGVIENMVKVFTNLPKGMQDTILAFTALVIAIGPASFIIGKVISAIGGLTGAANIIIPVLSKLAGGITSISTVAPILAAKLTTLKAILMTPLGTVGLIAGLVALGVAIEKPLQNLEKRIDNFYAKTFPKLKKIWEFGSKEQITGKFSDWEGTAGVMGKSEAFKQKEVSDAAIKAKKEEAKKIAAINKAAEEEKIQQAKAAAEIKKMLDEQEAERQKKIIKDTTADMKTRMKALADATKTPMQILASEFENLMAKFKGTSAEKAIKEWHGMAKTDVQTKQQEEISKKLADISLSIMKDGKEKELAILSRMQTEELKGFENNEQIKAALADKYAALRSDIETKYATENATKIADIMRQYAPEATYKEQLKVYEDMAKSQREILVNASATTEQLQAFDKAVKSGREEMEKVNKELEKTKKMKPFKDLLSSIDNVADAFDHVWGTETVNKIKDFTKNVSALTDTLNNMPSMLSNITSSWSTFSGAMTGTNFAGFASSILGTVSGIGTIFSTVQSIFSSILHKDEIEAAQRRMEMYAARAENVKRVLADLGAQGKAATAHLYTLISQDDINRLKNYQSMFEEYIIRGTSSLGDQLRAMRGTWNFTNEQLQAFSNYAVAAGKSADYFASIFNKAVVGDLTTWDYDEVISAINDMISKSGDLKDELVDLLNISVTDLGSAIESAFSQPDLASFKETLYSSVNDTIRQALINSFLAGDTLKPILSQLSDGIYNAISDGVLTATELTSLQGITQQLEGPMTALYETLNQLGLNTQNQVESAANTVSSVVSGMSDMLTTAFQTGNITNFMASLEESVYSSLRDGMFKAFLQTEAMQALASNLQNTISSALADSMVSQEELAGIRTAFQAIEEPMTGFYNILDSLGIGFKDLSGTTSALNNTLAQTESTLNAPSGFQTGAYRAAAVMPGNEPMTGQVTVNGNTFQIVANNPMELFEQLQKLQTSANVTNTGSPVNQGGLYGTG